MNPNITWDIVQANPDKPWNHGGLSANKMDKQPMSLQLAVRDVIHKYDTNTRLLPEALHEWCRTTLEIDDAEEEPAIYWRIAYSV